MTLVNYCDFALPTNKPMAPPGSDTAKRLFFNSQPIMPREVLQDVMSRFGDLIHVAYIKCNTIYLIIIFNSFSFISGMSFVLYAELLFLCFWTLFCFEIYKKKSVCVFFPAQNYGFAKFASVKSGTAALNTLNQKYIANSILRIYPARPKEEEEKQDTKHEMSCD